MALGVPPTSIDAVSTPSTLMVVFSTEQLKFVASQVIALKTNRQHANVSYAEQVLT